MKCAKFLLIIPMAFLLLAGPFSIQPAHAILGDVNGDGTVAIGDDTYLIAYLFLNGPPPVVRNDADVDNCPGVNLGDVLQLVDFLFLGGTLFPPVGTDLVVPSEIKITTGFVKGNAVGQAITLDVKINTVGQPNLYAVVIPLSYADLPGQTDVTCTSVNFTGTLLPAGLFTIDAPNERVLIWAVGGPGAPVIPTGSNGVIARINFTVVTPGTHNEILPTYYLPENTIVLISSIGYLLGAAPGRMLLPKFYTSVGCDANGDNVLSLPDIVWLINWIFIPGWPPPVNDP